MAKILVAEDSAGLRQDVGAWLREAGHTAVLAADGQEALRMYRTDRPFDLVLTDGLMPNLDGWELAQAVRQLCPDQKVVLASSAADWYVPNYFSGSLAKPYTKAALLAVVKKHLA